MNHLRHGSGWRGSARGAERATEGEEADAGGQREGERSDEMTAEHPEYAARESAQKEEFGEREPKHDPEGRLSDRGRAHVESEARPPEVSPRRTERVATPYRPGRHRDPARGR